MTSPVVDVFRFLQVPTKPFPYLGAMWIIELVQVDDHWECVTTAPLRQVLALAETEAALRNQIFQDGFPIVRYTKAWYLTRHLVSIQCVEQVRAA